MDTLPKLKVEGLGWDDTGELCLFEQAKYFPYESLDLLIVAEGEVIRGYEDLLQIAEKEGMKEKEYLEVKFLPIIVGG
ncbi:MAG: hypothetical protein JRJ85_06000 [Deltaproteobacteria bacterium]|nr:hypothetical protein [Deltaproteobacteria bacterium]